MAKAHVSPTTSTDYVKLKLGAESPSLNGQPSSGYSSGDYGEQEPNFKGNVDRWRCLICHRVVRNPVQTTCGHRFCERCLFEYLPADGTAVRCPANEEDCNMISREESNRTVGSKDHYKMSAQERQESLSFEGVSTAMVHWRGAGGEGFRLPCGGYGLFY